MYVYFGATASNNIISVADLSRKSPKAPWQSHLKNRHAPDLGQLPPGPQFWGREAVHPQHWGPGGRQDAIALTQAFFAIDTTGL